jgi:hypothetical protein
MDGCNPGVRVVTVDSEEDGLERDRSCSGAHERAGHAEAKHVPVVALEVHEHCVTWGRWEYCAAAEGWVDDEDAGDERRGKHAWEEEDETKVGVSDGESTRVA